MVKTTFLLLQWCTHASKNSKVLFTLVHVFDGSYRFIEMIAVTPISCKPNLNPNQLAKVIQLPDIHNYPISIKLE